MTTLTETAAAPRLPWPDDSLRFLRDGYLWGIRGFERVGGDAFRTRLLGRPVLVIRGQDAARFFYEEGRFRRGPGAVPLSARHLLQDDGSVNGLEGEAHRTRKRLFLDLVGAPPQQHAIAAAVRDAWRRLARDHEGRPVRLLEHAAEALTEGMLQHSGADAIDPDHGITASALMTMVENAGRFGPANWGARGRRLVTEERARMLVRRARELPPGATPVSRIAHHRENGELLDERAAAVELLNLLRPTAAVAHFVVFAAWALHQQPHRRAELLDSPERRHAFSQEVRRFFPFFPAVGGRATRELEWRGERLAPDNWVLLDLYGTDHDPAAWAHPGRFAPERFLVPDGHRLVVAQGAGDFETDHRCPGEPLTVTLVDELSRMLAEEPPVVLPDQDLRISLRRFPAMPREGLRVTFSAPPPAASAA